MEVLELESCIYIFKGSHLCGHDGLLNICLEFLVFVSLDIMVCLFLSLVKEYVKSDIFEI